MKSQHIRKVNRSQTYKEGGFGRPLCREKITLLGFSFLSRFFIERASLSMRKVKEREQIYGIILAVSKEGNRT